jgi:F-type H+-transporting ATPase subunit delta
MDKKQAIKAIYANVMDDPSAQAIARVYAEAFISAVGTDKEVELVEEFTSLVEDILAEFPDFYQLLTSGILSQDEQLGLIDRVVGKKGTEIFVNFLRVLARHGRLDLLPAILKESQLIHEKNAGKQRVKVTSAKELNESEIKNIQDKLAASLPFTPIIMPEVNPDLIGGIVIQIGDKVYDSSLRSRLKQLRDRLRQRSLNEIQSGRDRFCHSEGN